MGLSKVQLSALTRTRAAGNSLLDVSLDDEVCTYLLSVVAADLGFSEQLPTLPSSPAPFFGKAPLATRRVKNTDFMATYEQALSLKPDVDAYFACLAKLHKARLKYERILQAQPLPTMDQVGPRSLLQFGSVDSETLAGWLYWRKWIFDLDNRAGQETGYLFEPIIAFSIGGVPFGSAKSPIKRQGRSGGRQVDCIKEDGRRAYELKLRVTIAASGQGRWEEELQFPADAKGSGYTPILVVLDPTPNDKLKALERAFIDQGGEAYIGIEAWKHLEKQAGPTMAIFLERYVRSPLDSLPRDPLTRLPDLNLSMSDANELVVRIGADGFTIQRHADPALSSGPDALPQDIDSDLPTP